MSEAKLQAARELIHEKDYRAARAVLRSMPDDPTAIKWLAKLDQIAPEPVSQQRVSHIKSNGVNWLAILLIVIAIGVVGGVAYTIYQQNEQSRIRDRRAFCSLTYQQSSPQWQNCIDDKP